MLMIDEIWKKNLQQQPKIKYTDTNSRRCYICGSQYQYQASCPDKYKKEKQTLCTEYI